MKVALAGPMARRAPDEGGCRDPERSTWCCRGSPWAGQGGTSPRALARHSRLRWLHGDGGSAVSGLAVTRHNQVPRPAGHARFIISSSRLPEDSGVLPRGQKLTGAGQPHPWDNGRSWGATPWAPPAGMRPLTWAHSVECVHCGPVRRPELETAGGGRREPGKEARASAWAQRCRATCGHPRQKRGKGGGRPPRGRSV